MLAGAGIALILAAGSGGADSTVGGPRIDALRVGAGIDAPDTVRVRPKAFQLSKGYETRLRVHKWASYVTLPLFAAEYAAGDQLMKKGSDAPQWARTYHGVLAGGVAGLFTVNTVTGGWNWWETRGQPGGRTWRTVHGALMLLADAGFTVTGLLANEAENSGDKRRLHKRVAVVSMSVASLSYLMMLPPIRRD